MLLETTPSSMAASRFKYNTYILRWGEFSIAGALVRILPGSYISVMHYSFVSLLLTLFVRPRKKYRKRRHAALERMT